MTKFHIVGILRNVTEDDLRTLFAKYGAVSSVRLIRDTHNASVGHGIVEMDLDDEEAEELLKLDRPTLGGRQPLIWRPKTAISTRKAS